MTGKNKQLLAAFVAALVLLALAAILGGWAWDDGLLRL